MNKENQTIPVGPAIINEPNRSKSLKDYDLDDRKIVDKVIRDYETDKNSRLNWNTKRDKIYKRYRQESVRALPFDGASDIVVPVLQNCLDSISPRLNSAFLGKNPPISLTGTEENDKRGATLMEKYFNKYLTRIDYEDIIDEMNSGATTFGTVFIKDYFQDDEIQLSCIDANDIFLPFNATCKSLNDMAHVIHRYYRDRYWLSRRYGIDMSKLGKYEVIHEGTQQTKDRLEGRINDDDDYDQPVETLEWYGRWMIGEEMRDVVYVVAYKERILMGKWFLDEVVPYAKNPETGEPIRRLPINRILFKKVSGCAYGVGLGEDLSGMHDWTNSVVNAILDGNYWSIIPWGIKQEGSKLQLSDIKPHFGMFINVPSIDAIKFMNMPNQTQPMVELLPYIQAMVERVSGISDYGMGRESEVLGSQATATGTKAIIQEMLVRLDGYVSKASDDLKYTLQNVFYWIMATVDEQDIIRTLGSVDPKDIELIMNQPDPLKYDLNVNVNFGYGSRDQEKRTDMEVYQMTRQDPMLASNPQVMIETAKAVFDSMGKENLSGIIDEANKEESEELKAIGKIVQGDYEDPLIQDDHAKRISVIERYQGTKAYEGLPDNVKQMLEQRKQMHKMMLEQLKQEIMMQMGGQMGPGQPGMQSSGSPQLPPQGPPMAGMRTPPMGMPNA